jgi:hypothetical protein
MNGYVFSTVLDRRMIGNYVEVVVVCFKKLSYNLPGRNQESHKYLSQDK